MPEYRSLKLDEVFGEARFLLPSPKLEPDQTDLEFFWPVTALTRSILTLSKKRTLFLNLFQIDFDKTDVGLAGETLIREKTSIRPFLFDHSVMPTRLTYKEEPFSFGVRFRIRSIFNIAFAFVHLVSIIVPIVNIIVRSSSTGRFLFWLFNLLCPSINSQVLIRVVYVN